MELSFKEILEAIDGEVIVEGKETFNRLCIDTRKIESDNIYLAINGQCFLVNIVINPDMINAL